MKKPRATTAQIDHPVHYRPGVYEAIKVIRAWDLGFSLGNAVKYICRAGLKGGGDPTRTLEDLKKARWYIDEEIAVLEGRTEGVPV